VSKERALTGTGGPAVTRRRVLRSGVIGGSALAFSTLLGGAEVRAGSSAQGTPGASPTAGYAPATGVEREELVVGVQALPPTLDPARELSNVGTRVSYTPYDTLIRRDFLNNDLHVPSLATGWERVGDTELVLRLRDDVTFHNGDPFTADDVVFTFGRLLDAAPDSDLAEARTYFSTFDAVEQVDEYTVRITTPQPDPLIEKRLASWASWIVPRRYIEAVGEEEFLRTGMGTGPFRFVSFTPDDELVLERYDGYWGDRPTLRRLVFRVIPEVAARITALVNDEVQMITNVPPDQVATIAEADGVEVRDVALANVHVLSYNCNHPVLGDKRLRQALNLGIDRQLIIDAIWGGNAVPKRSHQFPEYGALYNPERPLTPYDPEAARRLIAESGYGGETIEYQLRAGYYTNGEQVAQAIVQMWQEIGIDAEVRIAEEAIEGPERMVHTWSNSSRLADPDGSLWVLWGRGSGIQQQYWPAPEEFNRLGDEARSTLDERLRYENYQRMLDIWEDDAPGTVLYDPVEFYGVRSSINWSPYAFYYMDFRPYNLSFEE
jgi:peptide/nickel transport system substrate-binding protein